MAKIGLWHMTSEGAQLLLGSHVELEKDLETWIEKDPELLSGGLTIVGRQVALESGRLDLLALDTQGRWNIIEIKKGSIHRKTIAQALDYASSIAFMPGEQLQQIMTAYLQKHGKQIEEIFDDERYSHDIFDDEDRDVTLFIVGTGQEPGLERIIKFLSERSQISISLVSFDVFTLPNGEKILGRELTETDTFSIPRKARIPVNTEEICQIADREGIGDAFRTILRTAEELQLPVRPYKHSIMYTPPQNRSRMLFTVPAYSTAGQIKLYTYAKAFTEFFPLSEQEVIEAIGQDGWHQLGSQEVNTFITSIKKLLAPLQVQEENEE